MNNFAVAIFFLALFAYTFSSQIGAQAGKAMNAFQAERMACDPDHWDMQ